MPITVDRIIIGIGIGAATGNLENWPAYARPVGRPRGRFVFGAGVIVHPLSDREAERCPGVLGLGVLAQ